MRTKLILTTAALGVASSLGAMAQVYSVNAVGYINVTVQPGKLGLVANQLNTGGNTVAEVIPTAPDGTILYKYSQAGGFAIIAREFGEWGTGGAQTVKPGEGFFVSNNGTTPLTLTFVGEVPQGSPLTTPLATGLNLVSSQVPQAGKLVADLGFPAADGDIVYQWDAAGSGAGAYKAPNGYEFGSFSLGDPDVAVGEAFFVSKAAAGNWSRNFSVNP
jgi:hypothetical protein